MSWYEKIVAAHLAVTDEVSHGYVIKSDRCFCWIETGRDDLNVNGRHGEKCQRGTTHLFTKTEFDPWKDAFEASLDAAGIAWYQASTQYEEDTGFWHFEWRWGVRYA